MESLLGTAAQLKPGMVVVVGLPSDHNSSFMNGPARAPARIRAVLSSGSANMCSEDGTDLSRDPRFKDMGDWEFTTGTDVLEQIEQGIGTLLEHGARVLSLGGDHAVTYPITKAYAKKYHRLNILHLDAHPDLYDRFNGNPYSHACPFARIMEKHLAARLVQVGIRTLNPHQRKQAARFGVEITDMKTWRPDRLPVFTGPVYLSLDMDVLDPAFAPGVSHHEPGGLSTREVIGLIQGFEGNLVGADIVEFNPERDPMEITAMAAGKFVKEIGSRMLQATGWTDAVLGAGDGRKQP